MFEGCRDDPSIKTFIDNNVGSKLGELTNEIAPTHQGIELVCPGWFIPIPTNFNDVVLGAKQYALRIRNLQTHEEDVMIKVRGITQDLENAGRLDFSTLKRQTEALVCGNDPESVIFDYVRFNRPRKGVVASVPMSKRFKPVNSKGPIRDDGVLVPYGYSP